MCGIAGFNWKDEALMEELAASLVHRGPDQSGLYADDRASMAHRRLSILDLSQHGIQPMSNETGDVMIVFNGEIFNYASLKQGLEKRGHKFVSHTDTEVLVHLYEEFGQDMLGQLNGQFAFCIYDMKKGELFLARDRIGILPLYYYDVGGKFIFASELKAIIAAGVPREINHDAVVEFFRFGVISAPNCILEGARKLKPAHYMVYSLGDKKITSYKRYWDVRFTREITDPGEASRLLSEKITESARMRLMADVPVGAFLSGGVDSSVVVSALVDAKSRLKTFSVKFEYKDFDESGYAKEVAKSLGTEHYEIVLKAGDIRKMMPDIVEEYDEPFGDSSALPMYFVSRFARQYVTVCLSGDGGDEILAGYDRYRQFFAIKALFLLPRPLRHAMRWALSRVLSVWPEFKLERVRELLLFDKSDDVSLFEKMMEKIDRDDLKALLRKDIDFPDTTADIATRNGISALQHWDMRYYLEGDILPKVDRAAMAVSLEARPPLLDHTLIELCARMSDGLKVKGLHGKWILKEAFRKRLPAVTTARSKKGFGVPIKYYLKNELYDLVEKYVFNYDKHGLFDRELLKGMSSGKKPRDTYRLYWNVMMFNMWHQRWICGTEPRP